MAEKKIDLKGLKCPIPVMRIERMVSLKEIVPGDVCEVVADCTAFPQDIRDWASKSKRLLLALQTTGVVHVAKIRF